MFASNETVLHHRQVRHIRQVANLKPVTENLANSRVLCELRVASKAGASTKMN
jgi:hypothetical protein